MKLVTCENKQSRWVGVLTDDLSAVMDLSAACAMAGKPAAMFADMLTLIEHGPAALDLAHMLRQDFVRLGLQEVSEPLADVRLCAPVPRPVQMRDFLSFEKHVQQCRTTRYKHAVKDEPDAQERFQAFVDQGGLRLAPVWFKQPIYYKGNRLSVIGHQQDVIWPDYSELLDYELEIGIFIGRQGKDIKPGRAREHIFGYTIFNDMSARDAQSEESAGQLGPAKGKDFDTGNIIGPWLVTADEIADPYNLSMKALVNGEVWSDTRSAGMQHSFEDMIVHVSRSETIHPGEFFGSGTAPGGCGLELDRWLKPDDVVELQVEGLGSLRNRIVGSVSGGG